MLDCACVLTENWFADYCPPENCIEWVSSDYNFKLFGKYGNGRAWLESPEGIEAIATMHVNAIMAYINSLRSEE